MSEKKTEEAAAQATVTLNPIEMHEKAFQSGSVPVAADYKAVVDDIYKSGRAIGLDPGNAGNGAGLTLDSNGKLAVNAVPHGGIDITTEGLTISLGPGLAIDPNNKIYAVDGAACALKDQLWLQYGDALRGSSIDYLIFGGRFAFANVPHEGSKYWTMVRLYTHDMGLVTYPLREWNGPEFLVFYDGRIPQRQTGGGTGWDVRLHFWTGHYDGDQLMTYRTTSTGSITDYVSQVDLDAGRVGLFLSSSKYSTPFPYLAVYDMQTVAYPDGFDALGVSGTGTIDY